MKKHSCFTLIEILCVIAILVILFGIILGGVRHASAKADHSRTIAKMTAFQMALEAFYADYGYYPVQKTEGNLNLDDDCWKLFLNKTTNKKNSSYLKEAVQEGTYDDAYDNAFQYQYPSSDKAKSTKYLLWSMGEDGTTNTEDDICSWKQN